MLEEMIFIVNKRIQCEQDYGNSLLEIGNTNQSDLGSYSNLSMLLERFKSDCISRYEKSMEYCRHLREDVMNELQELLFKQNSELRALMSEGMKWIQQIRNLSFKLFTSATDYWKHQHKADQSSKIFNNTKTALLTSKSKKKKLQDEAVKDGQEAVTKQKLYKVWLNNSNKFKAQYQDKINEIIDEYEKYDKQRIEKIISSIHHIIVYDYEKEQNVVFDLNLVRDTLKQVAIEDEVACYRERIKTTEDQSNRRLKFPETRDDDEYLSIAIKNDPLLRQYNDEMERIITNCWDGQDQKQKFDERKTVSLINQHSLQFQKIIRDKRGRKFFNRHINKYRSHMIMTLDRDAYFNLVELFKLLLDEIQKEHDTENAMLALTFAASYSMWETNENGEKQKVFLTQGIITHPIFKDLEFWKITITERIRQALKEQSIHDDVSEESQFERDERIKTVIFTKLYEMSLEMIQCHLDKNEIKKIVKGFEGTYHASLLSNGMAPSQQDEDDFKMRINMLCQEYIDNEQPVALPMQIVEDKRVLQKSMSDKNWIDELTPRQFMEEQKLTHFSSFPMPQLDKELSSDSQGPQGNSADRKRSDGESTLSRSTTYNKSPLLSPKAAAGMASQSNQIKEEVGKEGGTPPDEHDFQIVENDGEFKELDFSAYQTSSAKQLSSSLDEKLESSLLSPLKKPELKSFVSSQVLEIDGKLDEEQEERKIEKQ